MTDHRPNNQRPERSHKPQAGKRQAGQPAKPARTALFIDAAYLDKVLAGPLAHGGAPMLLDMRKLPALLAGEKPWRTYYYHAPPWQSDPPLPAEHEAAQRKARFIWFLSREPRWILREGVVERRGGFRPGDWVYEQKRSDVQLAVDLVRLAWQREIVRAVILAGDSDFVPAVEDARAAGVDVTLRYFPGFVHGDLSAACNQSKILGESELSGILR